MKVFIASPLRSYTQRSEVTAHGTTLAELMQDLERQFPGIRFRVIDEQDQLRPHMRVFINQQQVRAMGTVLEDGDAVYLVQALSGG
jgi:sulfur-carrier protein